MSHVYRQPFQYAAQHAARVEWQPQPFWAFEGVADGWSWYETYGEIRLTPQAEASLDVAGVVVERRAPLRHPGWQRRQAEDQLRRERALEAEIRDEYLIATGQKVREVPALAVPAVPQKTAAQVAAEMAADQTAVAARRRATELGAEAQRARRAIEALQPELQVRRREASFRVLADLLREL